MLLLLRFASQLSLILACCACSQVCQAGARSDFCPQRLDVGVYCGPAPKTRADVARLRRLGVCEIVDSRTVRRFACKREQRWARQCGLLYRRMPIPVRPAYTDCNLEAMLKIMRMRPRGTVYVHCHEGRDRTGLLAALYRYRYLGWTAQRAYCEMQRNQYNPRLVELDHYFWNSVRASRPLSSPPSPSQGAAIQRNDELSHPQSNAL